MASFDAVRVARECTAWIADWFEKNGPGCTAVIGISGGKDSSVTAALCCAALGRERVFGVLMPQGEQPDIDYSQALCEHLQIDHVTVNIGDTVQAVLDAIGDQLPISDQTRINLPSRIRMATLYAVSQSKNGRVANTCNLSEDHVGYSTRYGDSAGDFSPLSRLTATEVRAVGRALGLPPRFVDKVPTDGLCGQTDEEKLGFTYATLDAYIRDGVLPPPDVKERIDRLHRLNRFKLELMPCFEYTPDAKENADAPA